RDGPAGAFQYSRRFRRDVPGRIASPSSIPAALAVTPSRFVVCAWNLDGFEVDLLTLTEAASDQLRKGDQQADDDNLDQHEWDGAAIDVGGPDAVNALLRDPVDKRTHGRHAAQ